MSNFPKIVSISLISIIVSVLTIACGGDSSSKPLPTYYVIPTSPPNTSPSEESATVEKETTAASDAPTQSEIAEQPTAVESATKEPELGGGSPSSPPPDEGSRAGTNMIGYYAISLDDNGQSGIPFGCGDSAVFVPSEYIRDVSSTNITSRISNNLFLSLDIMFTMPLQEVEQLGLINLFSGRDMQFKDFDLPQTSGGTARLVLTGIITPAGDCDNARIEAQLLYTIFQYPDFDRVMIMTGDGILSQILTQDDTELFYYRSEWELNSENPEDE